ncbi:hypothetical protein NPIL_249811 [Nephila pilipes]|uniref:Uncharacterized protein n=1 Tax=Nephila pilipes TaxID=299642 RepID=A0A8X6NT85_NEPPI|nr:hypothetical protein NPIL_249811 [Nephila pilipes]
MRRNGSQRLSPASANCFQMVSIQPPLGAWKLKLPELQLLTFPSLIHYCQYRVTTISLLQRRRPIPLFDQPASLRPTIRFLSKHVICSCCSQIRLCDIVYPSWHLYSSYHAFRIPMLSNAPDFRISYVYRSLLRVSFASKVYT